MRTEKLFTVTIFMVGRKEKETQTNKRWIANFFSFAFNLFHNQTTSTCIVSFDKKEHAIIDTFKSMGTYKEEWLGLKFIHQLPLEVAKIIHNRLIDIKQQIGIKAGWSYDMPYSPIQEENNYLQVTKIRIDEFGLAEIVIEGIPRVYFDFDEIKL